MVLSGAVELGEADFLFFTVLFTTFHRFNIYNYLFLFFNLKKWRHQTGGKKIIFLWEIHTFRLTFKTAQNGSLAQLQPHLIPFPFTQVVLFTPLCLWCSSNCNASSASHLFSATFQGQPTPCPRLPHWGVRMSRTFFSPTMLKLFC